MERELKRRAVEMVKAAMGAESISQSELARRAGVSRQSVSQILTGGYDMKLSTLERLLEACGWEARFMLTEITPEEGTPIIPLARFETGA